MAETVKFVKRPLVYGAGALLLMIGGASLLRRIGLTMVGGEAVGVGLSEQPALISLASCFAGVGLLSVCGRSPWVASFSGAVVVIAAATLAGLPVWAAGITTFPAETPALLQGNWVLWLVAGGTSLGLMGWKSFRRRAVAVALLGSVLFGFGTAEALEELGGGLGVTRVFGTALTVALIGLGALAFAWAEGKDPRIGTPVWLPAPLWAGLLTASLSFWDALRGVAPSPWPSIILGAGGVVSLLVPLTVYFAQKSQLRAVQFEEANEVLRKEIEERERIERELKDSEGLNRQIEIALKEEEERFRRVFEDGPLALALIDQSRMLTRVNNAFSRLFGHAAQRVEGSSMEEITAVDDQKVLTEKLNELFARDESVVEMEVRLLTREGRTIWTHHTASVIRDSDGEVRCGVVMIENISERKETESKLLEYQERLQSMASEVSLTEERERRRIATNLHDRIGQSLAFARLKMGALATVLRVKGLGEEGREIASLIEQAIADTRTLTFELSPPVLYELGLVAAVEWLVQEFRENHQIVIGFEDDRHPKSLDDDLRVVLFQAVRELLVNIIKHSEASRALVSLRRDGDAIRILVEDDGIGFDPEQRTKRAGSALGFGLFNIRERLDYLGGQMKIRSLPGRGTRMTLLAPLKVEES